MKPTKRQLMKQKNDRVNFLTTYTPDLQMKICEDRDLCFFGQFPTLATINRQFGKGIAAVWLIPQIANLSEFCGCKNKITDRQIEECATIIAQQYYYLKVSELMLFFYDFKAGKYGKFYGNVDPMAITCALRDFVKDRAYAIDRHENEMRKRRDAGKGISYEEYCKLAHKKPHNRLSHVLPTTYQPKAQNAYSEAQIKSYAKLLASNTNQYPQETLEKFIEWFAKMFKDTPANWLKKHV